MKWSYNITGNGYNKKEAIEAVKAVMELDEKLILKTTEPGTVIIVSMNNNKLNVTAKSKCKTIVSSTINNPSEFIQKFIDDYYAVDVNISIYGRLLNNQPALHVSFDN